MTNVTTLISAKIRNNWVELKCFYHYSQFRFIGLLRYGIPTTNQSKTTADDTGSGSR